MATRKRKAKVKAKSPASSKKPTARRAAQSKASDHSGTEEDDDDDDDDWDDEPEPASKPRDGARSSSDDSHPRRGLKLFAATGVLGAALIAVSLNVGVTRYFERWDWTSTGMYTLSDATTQTLRKLTEPIDVVVLLSRSDPLRGSVQQMLLAYQAETRELRIRYIDPDASPVEYLSAQKEYGLDAREQVTDARVAVVIARGKKRWFVNGRDMVGYTDEGQVKPLLEQSLTVGIRSVLEREPIRVCFTTGHREYSIDDGSPEGLGELKYRIRKDNFEPVSIDLTAVQPEPLDACKVVVVAGPQVTMSKDAGERLGAYFDAGGNVMLLLNTVLDDEGRTQPSGLEALVEKAGIKLGQDYVIEQDPERQLTPVGGVFVAAPKRHEVTRGLGMEGGAAGLTVLGAQSLRAPKGTATSLLTSTGAAVALEDMQTVVRDNELPALDDDTPKGPFELAYAYQDPSAKEKGVRRMVVVGTANVAFSDNWRDPKLLPNRIFTLGALSWLAESDPIIDVPEKQTHAAGLNLTEDSRADVRNYVFIYMPGTAILLGFLVLYRRRAQEKRSRRRDDEDED